MQRFKKLLLVLVSLFFTVGTVGDIVLHKYLNFVFAAVPAIIFWMVTWVTL